MKVLGSWLGQLGAGAAVLSAEKQFESSWAAVMPQCSSEYIGKPLQIRSEAPVTMLWEKARKGNGSLESRLNGQLRN